MVSNIRNLLIWGECLPRQDACNIERPMNLHSKKLRPLYPCATSPRPNDSLAPARSALAGLWLRPHSFRRFPSGLSPVILTNLDWFGLILTLLIFLFFGKGFSTTNRKEGRMRIAEMVWAPTWEDLPFGCRGSCCGQECPRSPSSLWFRLRWDFDATRWRRSGLFCQYAPFDNVTVSEIAADLAVFAALYEEWIWSKWRRSYRQSRGTETEAAGGQNYVCNLRRVFLL